MIHKVIKINHIALSNSLNTCRILMLVLMTASICVLSTGVGTADDVNATLDLTLSKISGETENNEKFNLENGYTIRITDINKDVSPHKMRLILEKNNVELDDKILETGQDYSWHNNEDDITLNAEIFVGTSTNVVFFKNIYQISNGNTVIDNETFTIINSGGDIGSLNLNTGDYKNIDGFTASTENVLQSSMFPTASGYSQELLKENYSLKLLQLDVDGNKALISLSKNGEEVDIEVVRVGGSFNYNSSLSFKLDKVFVGTSSNYIEISNIYQYSEIDSSVIVQNESALLLAGLTGKFILTGGGLEWQLEENYTLHAIDIDIAGHSREAMLLITKDGTHVDYTIINVNDSYTYYQNENLIITADLETIFSGEGGVSLARMHHVYQYSEDTGETLLSDAKHLYSVGDTREVEWQLYQNYSLSAMDIDSKDTPRQVWLRLNKDGNTLEDIFLHSGDSATFYNSGTKILDLNVGTIFDGKEADLVFISDVYQYSETNKNDILLENEPYRFIFGNTTGNEWQLNENYTVSFMDIDIKKNPNQVWLRMEKNGVPVDDNVVAQNEEYKYYSNSVLLFEGDIKSAFCGRYLDMLTLTNISQYSEVDGIPLISDATYSFYPENVELFMDLNDKLSLNENYTVVPVDIQGFFSPQQVWLRLYKDDVLVDEVILLEGQNYSYYSGSIKIISTKLATIWMGTNTDLIKFEDFYHYSEVDGSLLNYYDDLLLRLGRFISPTAPVIISFEPTTPISDDVGASRKFTIFVDQSVDVNWYLNGTEMQFNESVSNAEYTNTSAAAGTWIISAIANNANGIAKQNWTWKVKPKTYPSGNRIWEEGAGMSDTYTWDPRSFSGFYYDLDTDEGSETLTTKNIGRSLKKGEIKYKTKPIPVEFENGRWGTYDIIGFMSDRYFAGYTDDTTFASSSDSLLYEEKLSRVLTDNDTKVKLNSGSVLELEEGYEFKVIEFSFDGETIMVGLFKDGDEVSETIVKEDDTFTYEKDLGKAEDMVIIAIYIDNVSIGQETSSVNIEGIFQISDEYIDVEKGDEFGLMEITSVSSSGITMRNEDPVSLGEGDDFNLMGKINIIVADDSSTLRFAPYVDMTETGTYELRGTVTEKEEFKWTPFNFETLMYDIDTGEGGETLHLERYGRTVDEGDLTYTTNLITKNFEHSNDDWNSFQSVGFIGETYFAGYLKESSFISSDISLISEGKLSKILMDEDKKHNLYIGNSLSFQDGYSMRIDEISQDSDKLMLSILKDGDELFTEIVSEGDDLVYEIEVDKIDIPIIVIHIDKVLGGMEGSSVYIKGIFQISDYFTSVEKGDAYGIMEVTKTTPSIVLSNKDDSISLDEGSVIDIMGNIKIKVADDSDVRFYPFQEIVVEETLYLDLDIPNSAHENEEFTISVTSDGDKVESVSITFNDTWIGSTDSNGELIYTPTETGKFKVTASKSGYQDASKYIDIADPNARFEYSNLTIEPKSVQTGEDVNITIVASNLGTFQDTDTMTLKVNGEEVMTKDLSLGPGESTTIEYTLNRSKPGTYLVEVNGQSDTFKVVSSPISPTRPVVLVEDVTAAPNGYAFTSIMVYNVTSLGSGIVNVTFDPAAIQVIDVTSGDGNALTVQDCDIDNTAGLVQIAAWDADEPHNGDVVFAHVTLHSVGDHLGSSPLAVTSAELTNYQTYEPINHTVATGTIETIAPDVIIDNVEAAPGESTTALIMVNNASNLGSGSITVTYNSSVVHVTNVTSGDGNALVVQDWNMDNTAGSVTIAAWDTDKSHNGDVVFANVTFHAVGEYSDSTPLAISSSELIDYTSYGIIEHSVTNGIFRIIDKPPMIRDAIATPDVILNDNDRPRIPGTNVTVLNATVNGGYGVASVTIDLSEIGGSGDQVMERIAGTDIWTVATNATDGINLTHELVVTATDGANNTDTSVIGLTVLLRGDVVRDGDLNSADALYIAKYLVGVEDMLSLLVGDISPAKGDGEITSADALYLAKYLVGKEAAP